MERTYNLKTLLLSFGCLICSFSAHADESWIFGGLETFFGISLVAGVTETNLVDQNFQRVDETRNYLEGNIEIQLRWNGFFYENPGHSQENVDGLFSGDAIGYNFYNSKHWAYDIYVVNAFGEGEYHFDNVETVINGETGESTNNHVRLLLPRKANDRLGLRATGYYDDYLAQFIVTPVSFQSEIKGVNASASLRRTWLYKNWNFFGTVGFNYHSKEIIDYYWGLSEDESTQIEDLLKNQNTPFKPYEGSGGFFAVGQLGFEYPVTENVVFGGFVTAIRRPNAVTDSTLSFEGRVVSTAGVSLTWVF